MPFSAALSVPGFGEGRVLPLPGPRGNPHQEPRARHFTIQVYRNIYILVLTNQFNPLIHADAPSLGFWPYTKNTFRQPIPENS